MPNTRITHKITPEFPNRLSDLQQGEFAKTDMGFYVMRLDDGWFANLSNGFRFSISSNPCKILKDTEVTLHL